MYVEIDYGNIRIMMGMIIYVMCEKLHKNWKIVEKIYMYEI